MRELRHVSVEMAPGRGFRDPVGASYSRAEMPRTVALTVPSFAAAAAVASATDFVATLPRSLLEAQGRASSLVALRGPVPEHAVSMALCWHERTHADPAAIAFRALVKAALTAKSKP